MGKKILKWWGQGIVFQRSVLGAFFLSIFYRPCLVGCLFLFRF